MRCCEKNRGGPGRFALVCALLLTACAALALCAGGPSPEPPPDVAEGEWLLVWGGGDWLMKLAPSGRYECSHPDLPFHEGSWAYDRESRTLCVWDRAVYEDGSKGPVHAWVLRIDGGMEGTARRVAGPLAGRTTEASLRRLKR